MRKYRFARFSAGALLVGSLILFLLGIIPAIMVAVGGLGAGWAAGWRGWLVIPLIVGAIGGALALMVYGALLWTLVRIQENFAVLQEERRAAAAVAKAAIIAPEPVAAPEAEVRMAPEAEVAAASAAAAEVSLPEAAAVAVAAETIAPEAQAEVVPEAEVAMASAEITAPEAAAVVAAAEAVAPKAEAEVVAAPSDQPPDQVEALRDELAALQVRLSELEQPPAEPGTSAPAEAEASVKLPGVDEAERIASEIAAAKQSPKPES